MRRGGRDAFIDVVVAQSSFVSRVTTVTLERVDSVATCSSYARIGIAIVNVCLTAKTSVTSEAITYVRSFGVRTRSLVSWTVFTEILTFVDVVLTSVSLPFVRAATNKVSVVVTFDK